ncbi:MAG: replication initiator protein A [Cetobacterium sp.]
MSRMKIKDFKKLEFYQLPKWLLKVNGLKPVDIVVYTLAFNNWKLSVKNNLVNENEEIYFFMTHEGIRDEIEIGKDQVIDSIKRLVESKVIIQEKFQGKATRFYLEDDLNQIKFKDVKNPKSSRKKSTTENPTTPVGKSDHTSTENPTTNQSENTDINKTNLLNKTKLIKTTTKLNYIYPIDNSNKKNSSSSISEEINELKKYLMQEIHDVPTCKNIMFLVENRDLNLERIKTVVEYSKKNKKGNGYIYSALENNWDIPSDNIKNNFVSSLDKEKEFIEKRQFERMEVEKQKLPQVELTPELEKELIEKAVLIDKISKGFLVTMKTKNKIMYENMLKKYLD